MRLYGDVAEIVVALLPGGGTGSQEGLTGQLALADTLYQFSTSNTEATWLHRRSVVAASASRWSSVLPCANVRFRAPFETGARRSMSSFLW